MDHVLPIKEFKDHPDLCYSWFNMRPMSKVQNRQKSATVEWGLFKEQLDRSINFMIKMTNDFWFVNRDQNVIENWKRIITQYFLSYPHFDNMFLLNDILKLNNDISQNGLSHGALNLEKVNSMTYMNIKLKNNLATIRLPTPEDLKMNFQLTSSYQNQKSIKINE